MENEYVEQLLRFNDDYESLYAYTLGVIQTLAEDKKCKEILYVINAFEVVKNLKR